VSRILIVDNDPTQTRLLARSLARKRPDLTVVTSTNGAEAVRVMGERAVDLIITNLLMPELDGFELLGWVAKNCPEVPVFVMSDSSADDTKARVNELGAVAYFSKPLDLKAVLARMTDELSQTVRGHVQNVSLASFLQLMEMERKTCTLTVSCAESSGKLVIRKGELIAAETAELRGTQAAIAIIAWPNPSITISSPLAAEPRAIEEPLGFIIMEAMRVQDEIMRNAPASELPGTGNTVYPIGENGAAKRRSSIAVNGQLCLSSGVRALAIVETATGDLLRSAAADGCPVREVALMAAQVLRHQVDVVSLCDTREGVEEMVLSSTSRCELVRPLGGKVGRFALLVFAPEETNLAMARMELDRFIFTEGRL